MPNQNNLIRPSSTVYSASSTMKLHDTASEKERKKTSIVILTLLSLIIFLFILSLLLICALVVVGKGLADKGDKQHSSIVESSNDISSISLINRANKNTIHSVNTKFNKKYNMSIAKIVDKLTFRLPRQITPVAYNLLLHPDLKNQTFTGNVKIDFAVSEPINFVALHSKFLKVQPKSLVKQLENGAEGIGIKNAFEYEPFEYFIVEPDSLLNVGNYTIDLDFEGRLDRSIVGFYGSSYFDKVKQQKRFIATSKFEPTFARQSFPCFDEPAMKATYKVSLISPDSDGYSALSNMDVENEEPYAAGLKRVDFHKSVPMSTYLTVFIVSDFDNISIPIEPEHGENFTVRCFGTPEQVKAGKLAFALDLAAKVIKFYIGYFKIPYPLPKLDMAAIPDFVSGAMETWGLVTYRETNLIYDPKVSSSANKQRVAAVIGHEFAHMWFGNLVTMKWWSDLWLNEGFASYIEFKGVHSALEEWQIQDQFTIDTMHSIMNSDATVASHPIVVGVETPSQITEIFDGVTYNKGASIIRMIEDFIGPENFQNGVSEYLDAKKYETADSDDLLFHLENKTTENLSAIVNTWIRQKGLPVVTATKQGSSYKLTQKRFLIDPDSESTETTVSEYNYRWSIPITYVTSNEPAITKRAWFYHDRAEITIPVDDSVEWIKFNKDQVGYYRVKYENDMWMSLNAALERDVTTMSVLDRAHLLNDVFSLAEGGLVDYSIALEMTKYLARENSFVPWDVAASKLKGIRSLLYYTQHQKSFRDYAQKLVGEAFTKVNQTIDPDAHLDNLFRNTIYDLACSMEHPGCVKLMSDFFREWIDSSTRDTDRPPADIRSLVYSVGMKSPLTTEKDWDTIWEMFVKETDAVEKAKLQACLTAFREPLVLKRLIDLAADETFVRGQDYFTLMGQIAGNRNGEALVWDYVRENWMNLVARFGLNERYLGRMIPTITSRFTTQTKLEEMEAFFAKYPDAGAGANARLQALESVRNNIKFLNKHQDSIGKWLKEQEA